MAFKTLPKHLVETFSELSNFDYKIPDGLEEELKRGKSFAGYAGWNFYGKVWYEEGVFYCQVKQYRVHVNTIEAESLTEIMTIVGYAYGYD